MNIKQGSVVLAYDWSTHKETLDLDTIQANYKPAVVIIIRQYNVLADIQFISSGRIQKGALIPMFRPHVPA